MENKYLKYKSKYLNKKNMYGGMIGDFYQYDVYMVLQRKSKEKDEKLSVDNLLKENRLTKIGNVEHQKFNLDPNYESSIIRLPLVKTVMEKILEYIYFNNTPNSKFEPISFTCKDESEYINIHIIKKELYRSGTKYFIYQKSDRGKKLLILITTYKAHDGYTDWWGMEDEANTKKTFLTTIKEIQSITKEDYIKHFQSANDSIESIIKLLKDNYINKLIKEYGTTTTTSTTTATTTTTTTRTTTTTTTPTLIEISKIFEEDYIKKINDISEQYDNIKVNIENILDSITKLKDETNILESMYKNIKICEYIKNLKYYFAFCENIEILNKIKEYIYYTGISNNIKEYHDKAIIDEHGYNNFTDIQLIDETNINTIPFLLPRS